MRDQKEKKKKKKKTSQNISDSSKYYLITIDYTKQLWLHSSFFFYFLFLTTNHLNLLNFDFWFLHEIFRSKIKAKILPFNSLHLFPWVPWFYILFSYSWKHYHMYFVFQYLIPKCFGQRLRIIHTIKSTLMENFLSF
jgi:hypothetical protein